MRGGRNRYERVRRQVYSKEYQLLKETNKQVRQANRRIELLQKEFKSPTYASKKLANRLDNLKLDSWKNGKITIPKKATMTQLYAIQKATKQFLTSQTSTVQGVKDVRKSVKSSIKKSLSLEGLDISDKDADDYYKMLSDSDFDFFNDERVGASTLWNLIEDAKEENQSKNKFIDTITKYRNSNDKETRERASRLYDKYVL